MATYEAEVRNTIFRRNSAQGNGGALAFMPTGPARIETLGQHHWIFGAALSQNGAEDDVVAHDDDDDDDDGHDGADDVDDGDFCQYITMMAMAIANLMGIAVVVTVMTTMIIRCWCCRGPNYWPRIITTRLMPDLHHPTSLGWMEN